MKSLPRVLASVALVLAGITVNAQTHPSRIPAVHPIPSAPTKVFAPASFSALPELQCKRRLPGAGPAPGIHVVRRLPDIQLEYPESCASRAHASPTGRE